MPDTVPASVLMKKAGPGTESGVTDVRGYMKRNGTEAGETM